MSTVRSLPFPAIEDGNLSFPEGAYSVTRQSVDASGAKVVLRHEITGAPFIEGLIEKGEVKFACLVSVPKTGYRELHIADGREQEIGWVLDVAGEPPMLGPIVLYVGNGLKHEFSERDGVASVWQRQQVEIPKGARLARGRYLRSRSLAKSLLRVRQREAMKPGSFTVTPHTNDGFHFKLYAAKDIFHFLQRSEDRHLRSSIIIHAISQCLSILKTRYNVSSEDEEGDDHWDQHKNLVALASFLADKGMPHWSDEGFDAVEVATILYPIILPPSKEQE